MNAWKALALVPLLFAGVAFGSESIGYEVEKIEWRNDEKTGDWFIDTNECAGCISHWYRLSDSTLLRYRNKPVSAETAKCLEIRMAYIVVDPVKRQALEIHLN